MTDSGNSKLLEEVKTTIRALLLSVKDGLTTKKLMNDYREMVGTWVPYQNFGFRSIDDFLFSLRDVLRGTRLSSGDALWFPVADSSTAHILSLVNRQKSNTRFGASRSCPPRRPSYYVPRSFTPIVPIREDYSKLTATLGLKTTIDRTRGGHQEEREFPNKSTQPKICLPRFQRQIFNHCPQLAPKKTSSSSSSQLRSDLLPGIPETTKKQIMHLMKIHSNGLDLIKFEQEFYKYWHCPLYPEQYGFSTMQEFAMALPDILIVRHTGAALFVFANQMKKSDEQVTASNISFPVTTIECEKSRSEPVHGLHDHEKRSKHTSWECDDNDFDDRDIISCNMTEDVKEEEFVSRRLKEEFRQLLDQNPKGFWARQLSTLYKKEFDKTLDFQELGFLSLSGLLTAIPDVFECHRPSPFSDWILYDARKGKPDVAVVREVEHPSCLNSASSTVDPTILKEQVVKFLQKHSRGVYIDYFTNHFKVYKNDKEVPITSFGFSSIKSMLQHLVHDNVVTLNDIVSGTESDTIVKLAPEAISRFIPNLSARNVSKETKIRTIPEDAVVLGETLILQPLPEGCKLKSYFEAIPSEVNGPHDFYVQIRGESTSVALEDLMTDLDNVYNNTSKDGYEVPASLLRVGLLCAAMWTDQNWHRGLIMNVVDENRVRMFYVDFGTIATVKNTDIRLLKKQFTKLPAQARAAKMANVIPFGHTFTVTQLQWSDAAKKRFYELTANRSLIARILGFGKRPITKTQILALDLIDTTQKQEVHLNDLLVQENLAQFYGEYSTQSGGTPPLANPTMNMFTAMLAYQQLMMNVGAMTNPMYNADWTTMSASVTNMSTTESQGNFSESQSAAWMNLLNYTLPPTDTSNINYLPLMQNAYGSAFQRTSDSRSNITQQQQPSVSTSNVMCNNKLTTEIGDKKKHDIDIASTLRAESCKRTDEVEVKKFEDGRGKVFTPNNGTLPQVENKSAGGGAGAAAYDLDYLDDLCSELDNLDLGRKRFVKLARLTPTCTVHLILYNEALYLSGREVSAFFWKRDLLRNKLRILGMKMPFALINECDEPALFADLMHFDMLSPPLEGQPHTLMIYPLTSMGKLIDTFGPGMNDLRKAIEVEIDRFDPNDTYWGNSDDGISMGVVSDAIDGMNETEGLEVGLQVLRSRRYAIERELEKETKTTLQDELKLVNDRIDMLERALKK